jgi:hypothetical protein
MELECLNDRRRRRQMVYLAVQMERARIVVMSARPRDTSDASWVAQRDAVGGMDPASRVRAAIDLSDSVREIQIQGLLARNPAWKRSDAVHALIQRLGTRIRP